MVAEIEANFQRQLSNSAGCTKVRIRIPERANPEVFAGDKAKDKEGFVEWHDRLEMHLDTLWPGLAEVFDKIRDATGTLGAEDFTRLVSVYCDKPHDMKEEDWEMRSVGRHVYTVVIDHTTSDSKKTVMSLPKRDGSRRTGY